MFAPGKGLPAQATTTRYVLQQCLDRRDNAVMSDKVKITALANGPLQVQGPVEVTGANGVTRELDKAFLCRCGQSNAKPYCDGTHKRVGFVDPAPTE